ncbi:MAG: RDD family protein [Armatimonadota bacterium]
MNQDRLDIETPEHVRFSYALAGFGSRFLAAVLDHIIQGLISLMLFLAVAAISEAYPPFAERSAAFATILITANLFIFLGYYILFEMLWNGQTPGKRSASLRVIRDNGTPITLTESLLRNLLRPIDFLPGYYGAGILSILLSRQGKRLGDFVAGTVVVHEYVEEVPVELPPVAGATEQQVQLLLPLVPRITQQECDAVEHFIDRRGEVDAAVRTRLAQRLAGSIRARLGTIPATTPEDPEAFLELLYLAILRRRERL